MAKHQRAYSDEDRTRGLLALDACGGNVKRAAEQTGYPRTTLTEWKLGRVHPEVTTCRQAQRAPLADRLEDLAHQLIDAIPGKLAAGTLRECASTLAVAVEKMRLLREQATSLDRHEITDDQRVGQGLLRCMNASQRAELDRLLTGTNRPPSTEGAAGKPALWTPLPGPQTQAYESAADITGYGGGGGGGKTFLLLGNAVTRQRKSLILRREKTQVVDLWAKLLEITGGGRSPGRANETLHLLRDLPGDWSVELGGMKDAGDWRRYAGRAFDGHFFDELCEFSEAQFRSLIAWNRTTIPGQRCRVIGAFNPPTSTEGEWVLRYFAPWLDPTHPDPAEPGELRWYATVGGEEVECPDGTPFDHAGELITPRSRTFFPARVTDNPYLLATGYVATLQGLPEPLRSQLLYGDFEAGVDDDPWQVIPTEWVRLAQRRWRERPRPHTPMDCLAVDPARGGRDQTVPSARCGSWFAPLAKYPGAATPDGPSVAALVVQAREDACPVVVDVIGIGSSVYDALADLRPVAFNGAAASSARDRTGQFGMRNLRAAGYWALREALDPASGQDLALPDDRQLLADLTAARWKLTVSGIQIEEKAEIAARLGRSPDCGDAVMMCYSGLLTGNAFVPYVLVGRPRSV